MSTITAISQPRPWRGDELAHAQGARYLFTESEIAEVINALAKVKQQTLPLERISPAQFPLVRFGQKLNEISEALERGPGACRLLGFPSHRFAVNDLKRIFWGIGSYLGTPVSQSASGERLLSVRDGGYGVADPKTRGPNTNKRLRFHTDRCDVIAFMCLNQARSGGDNYLVSSAAVHNEILHRRPDLLAELYRPFHYLRHTVDRGNARSFCTQPIFAVHEGHFIANVLRVLIERAHHEPSLPNLTDIQIEALDLLDEVAEDPSLHFRFRQQPGDLLFVNNFTVFHRRDAFEDHLEPEQRRHLLRLWLSVPNSRPLPAVFAGNYGKTGAGELRGGMNPK